MTFSWASAPEAALLSLPAAEEVLVGLFRLRRSSSCGLSVHLESSPPKLGIDIEVGRTHLS